MSIGQIKQGQLAAKPYRIESRFLVAGEGWKLETAEVTGSYDAAGREASRAARELDERFGDDHFWTVELKGEHGTYFQLFHGRLS